MNTNNQGWSHKLRNDSNAPSKTGVVVSATTWFAMKALIHQKQKDFFAEAIENNLTFEEVFLIISQNIDIIRNKTLYNFLISRNPTTDQIKQLDKLFDT